MRRVPKKDAGRISFYGDIPAAEGDLKDE